MVFRLLVGLGNPGDSYAKTRHNAGFEVMDRLADGARWESCRYAKADCVEVKGMGLLLKPRTFMNLSGEAVAGALRWHKWGIDELLVVVDDVELPLGTLRMRLKGSAGGHNGLKSIEQVLGTRDYARLRVGVGRGEEKRGDLADHVLGRWNAEEEKIFEGVKQRAAETIKVCQTQGVEAGMMFGNRKV